MKKFTIPCDFGGKKAPFDVYIGHPKSGNHPLQNQAAWLSAERGGNIPPDVMESFAKLLKLSAENGVEFEDLCVYALEEAQKPAAAPAPKPAPQVVAPAPQPAANPLPQAEAVPAAQQQPAASQPQQPLAPQATAAPQSPVAAPQTHVNEHGQEVRYNPVELKMGDGKPATSDSASAPVQAQTPATSPTETAAVVPATPSNNAPKAPVSEQNTPQNS